MRVELSGLASRVLKIGRSRVRRRPWRPRWPAWMLVSSGESSRPVSKILIESRLTVAPHHQRAHRCTRRPARLSPSQGRWSWCRSPSSMRKKRLEGAKHDDAAAGSSGCVGQRVGPGGYLTVDHCWLPGVRCALTRSFALLSNLHISEGAGLIHQLDDGRGVLWHCRGSWCRCRTSGGGVLERRCGGFARAAA